jgi:Icc protein
MEERNDRVLRILQVSDCHVAADPAADYRGQNADRNLLSLLPVMRAWDPHRVLLTGDVSEDGNAASYARVAVRLGTLGSPVLALPGNHDEPETMRGHFGFGPWRGPIAQQLGHWQLVLLDSTVPGQIAGSFSQQELERFDALLRASTASFILVALHHQPVPVGSDWIDRYPLERPEAFWQICDLDRRIRCLAWGHIHQDWRAQRRGVALLGAPSTAANSLPDRERFTLDLDGPACRWIELAPDGAVQTGVLRAAQSSAGSNSQRIR